VRNPTQLGKILTIYGDFNDSSAQDANVLCSFYIFDLNETGDPLIERLTDQYTDAMGFFGTIVLITDPPFKRDRDYNVVTACDTGVADATFTVGQKETIAHTVEQEWEYLFNQENLDTAAIIGSFAILIIIIMGFFYYSYKKVKSW